ncbi:long-chain acyl-CoA synthetase [Algoriphagus iocasae]|uniref:Long-chain acyl-CoA synthetase n=1 Tax=Algoriphagus iocasae TaxID=1836499 RepID=A0A841MEG9_9BACT|nr:long-chain fatty acid--CoA ligase [Algoriphagus iocasae]MBB6326492.1 long-chain acyl-CoA synthetase [Algoriphagus iocasae]
MTPDRLFDLIPYQISQYDKNVSLAFKENNSWQTYSSRDLKEITENLSLAFLNSGISKGDKVAIISNNRPEWNFVDLALQQIGAISVPMYPTITTEDYRYIFEHAEVKMVFVGDQEILEKVKAANPELKVFSFHQLDGVDFWKDFMKSGENGDLQILEDSKASVETDDLFTIIYTSGTTGRPKGVMLSHKNVLSNVMSVSEILTLERGKDKVLSFLPLCHIFERTASFCHLKMGISIYYAENLELIGDNLREIKPQGFNTVPRLLEKIYDKIVSKGYELKGIKRSLFFWALKLGHEYNPSEDQGAWYNWQLKMANKLIFSKWREALGGEIVQINCGASALQPRLARVFWAAGIKVCEGYGLTETSPVVSASICNHKEIRIGYVGKLLKDVEVQIASDGEILVKGPNVMLGYYKQPDVTAEVLKNGWFHTGDIGELDGEYLKITDRKKEMFKTSGGKYVAPQVIENKIKESSLIDQVMVIGENRNYVVALIIPSEDGLKEYCRHKGFPFTEMSEMILKPEVIAKYERVLEDMNKYFAKWETIKRFKLLPEPWGIESGELTPTMKLKRKIILSKYQKDIDAIYSS